MSLTTAITGSFGLIVARPNQILEIRVQINLHILIDFNLSQNN